MCLHDGSEMLVYNLIRRQQNIIVSFTILSEVLHNCETTVLRTSYQCKYLQDMFHKNSNMTNIKNHSKYGSFFQNPLNSQHCKKLTMFVHVLLEKYYINLHVLL